MTKMAAIPIYGKNLNNSSSLEPVDRFQQNWVLIIVCINHDLALTLTIFMARSNMVT